MQAVHGGQQVEEAGGRIAGRQSLRLRTSASQAQSCTSRKASAQRPPTASSSARAAPLRAAAAAPARCSATLPATSSAGAQPELPGQRNGDRIAAAMRIT